MERDILVIGAGILGAAVAFALGRRGLGQRVVLIERESPAGGATSRAAALITVARDKTHFIPLAQETRRAIDTLRMEFGADVGLCAVGALHVASERSAPAMREAAARCSQFGIEYCVLDRDQALRHARWLSPDAFDTGVFYPQEAYVDPYLLSSAYLRASTAMGVQLLAGRGVQRIERDGESVCGVELTDGSKLAARVVVNAAGAWANALSLPLEVPLPMAPVRSQYWITEPADCFAATVSIVLMPEIGAYARPEVGGLLFGIRERKSATADFRTLPSNLAGFTFDAEDPNGWNCLTEAADKLHRYIPALASTGIAHYVCGPSNYTPDGELIVGGASAIPGMYFATGCNGAGIALSGGIGRLVAELIAGEPPFVDPSPHNPERRGKFDPTAPDFLDACAATRRAKTSG